MVNRSKNLGTSAESAVVKYLRANGWPHAKRLTLSGRYDLGDVTLGDDWPVTIEVKAGHSAESASDAQVEKWLEETDLERRNGGNVYGALILKRKGISTANAGSWWVVMEALRYDSLRGDKVPPRVHYDINPHLPVRFTLDHFAQCLRAAGLWPGVDSIEQLSENKGNPNEKEDA